MLQTFVYEDTEGQINLTLIGSNSKCEHPDHTVFSLYTIHPGYMVRPGTPLILLNEHEEVPLYLLNSYVTMREDKKHLWHFSVDIPHKDLAALDRFDTFLFGNYRLEGVGEAIRYYIEQVENLSVCN